MALTREDNLEADGGVIGPPCSVPLAIRETDPIRRAFDTQ